MMTSKRLNLNLASHPLRNRRFFYLLLSVTGIVFILVGYPAGKTFLQFRSEAQKVKASIKKTDQLIWNTEREEKKFSARIDEAAKLDQAKIDLMNSIILKKSFSWTGFLSDLENSLPDSSYIVSLAPALSEDSRLQLRLRVASPNLDELLSFLKNLRALKFDQIKIEGEALNERGLLLSEISLSFSHERII